MRFNRVLRCHHEIVAEHLQTTPRTRIRSTIGFLLSYFINLLRMMNTKRRRKMVLRPLSRSTMIASSNSSHRSECSHVLPTRTFFGCVRRRSKHFGASFVLLRMLSGRILSEKKQMLSTLIEISLSSSSRGRHSRQLPQTGMRI